MLPSTGYFKTINCPFYETGTCDRPYCHFKHARREDVGVAAGAGAAEGLPSGQLRERRTSVGGSGNGSGNGNDNDNENENSNISGNENSHGSGTDNGNDGGNVEDRGTCSGNGSVGIASDSEVLQQLVTEAVKKVLADRETTDAGGFPENVVSQVVEGLKPSLARDSSDNTAETNRMESSAGIPKQLPCVYNPTPIAELKKRHIPTIVSYMPSRETRVAVKRKSSPDGTKAWHGVVREAAELKYKPTAITNAGNDRESVQSYVPTCKSDSCSTNSYDDGNSNDYLSKLKEPYYPKSKKRREEYVPRKVKAPLKSVGQLDEQVARSFGRFESEFEAIGYDELTDADRSARIARTSRSSARTIRNVSRVPFVEDSQDSFLDLEAKFSEDEAVEEATELSANDEESFSDTKATSRVDYSDEKENENKCHGKIGSSGKRGIDGVCRDETNEPKERDATVPFADSTAPRLDESELCEAPKHESRENGKRSRAERRTEEKSKKREVEEKSRRDASSRTERYRDRHKHGSERRDSSDKARGTSRSRDKSTKEREASERRNSESRKDRGAVGKDSHERLRHGSSEKRHDRQSRKNRSRSRSPKLGDRSSKGVDHSRNRDRSRSKHRSNGDSSKKSKSVGGKGLSSGHLQGTLKSGRSSASDAEKKEKSKQRKKEVEVEDAEVEEDEEEDEDDEGERDTDDNDDRYDIDDDNTVDDVVLNLSDSDHDVQEECLKIFQEYQVTAQRKVVTAKEPQSSSRNQSERSERIDRKRVAHASAATAAISRQVGPSHSARKHINPQQKMYERWRLMREAAAEKAAERAAAEGKAGSAADVQPCSSEELQKEGHDESTIAVGNSNANRSNEQIQINESGNGRIRIAHVPYARSLAMQKTMVKDKVGSKAAEGKATTESKTAAQTAKSGIRVAHVPQVVPQLIRPEPLQVATQKFPLNVRQYCVNIMHDVCVQIYTNAEDAAQRAVKEEFACHERCKSLAVYKSSCMLAAHRLKKEVDQRGTAESTAGGASSSSGMVSHEAVLSGKTKGSWSVLRNTKKSVTEFKGAALYTMLKKWIMTEEQLRENGFPRPHPDGQKGRAKVYVINSRTQGILSKVPNERICSRCGKSYTVDKQGLAVTQENCIYHWGRKFTRRGESRYSCCQQYGLAGGCCDAKGHVWEYIDFENLRGYVKTLPKDIPVEEQGVYSLDCEMSYTTQGLELTRITVINEDCNVVYETLVKPQNPIIDYNTRFSGITEEDMTDVVTTLLDVQATLLTMFSDRTILVGHSLESDFKALKLLHDTVVDTSVMFPHKNGYPQKRALKNLCSDYLRKLIQNDVGGHDSKEDAVACMELIRWKVKEEAKLQ